MSITKGRLYGVITKILPDGEFGLCDPIFIDYWNYNLNQNQHFYKAIWSDFPNKHIKAFEEIDITKYGKPLFLPCSRKKINDNKEYLIIFQKSKNATPSTARKGYFETPAAGIDYCLTVGIKFPYKFLAVSRDCSKEELLNFIE